MKKTAALIFALLSLTISNSLRAQDADVIRLTLEDCIVKALKDNLDISVQSFTPDIQEAAISQAKEIFLPKVDISYETQKRNPLSSWGLEGASYSTEGGSYNFSLNQKFLTGADLSLLYYNTSEESTRFLTAVNPWYYNYLRFNVTQPLLRNFGPRVTRYSIKKSENQRDISLADLNATLIQKVFQVEEAYWNLANARESLKVREMSLAHSIEQLESIQEAARIGAKFASDVLKSETEVANWENQVLASRNQVEMYEDELKQLLNLPKDSLESSKSLIPEDEPVIEKPELSFEEALGISMQRHPDILKLQKELEDNGLEISYQKNQLLPKLDLNFSLWYTGQSGVRKIYQDDNPFSGVVIDTVEGDRWDAFQQILDRDFHNWTLSLDLTIPLESLFSRAKLAQATLERDRKNAERERLESRIYYDVLQVFKNLRNNEQRLESTVRHRELVEKKLGAEEQRYRLGLVGSEWVFQYQRELAQARADEIKAIIDYKIAAASLERVMGTSLTSKGLTYR